MLHQKSLAAMASMAAILVAGANQAKALTLTGTIGTKAAAAYSGVAFQANSAFVAGFGTNSMSSESSLTHCPGGMCIPRPGR